MHENLAAQLEKKDYRTEIELFNGETIVNRKIKAFFKQKHKFKEKAKAEQRERLQVIRYCMARERTGSRGHSCHQKQHERNTCSASQWHKHQHWLPM